MLSVHSMIQKQIIDNQEAQGYEFLINEVYQIRSNIKQDINYTFTESIKSMLVVKKTVRSMYVFG